MWLIPAIIFSTCFVFFISWVYKNGSKKQEKDNGINKKYRIAWILFIAYIIVTFQTVLFSREAGSRKEISLVLFETWGHSFHMHAMFIENIIMFIPLGMLRAFRKTSLFRIKNVLKELCVYTGISCAIEGAQLVTGRGYCQIDDVVMNVLGGILGYLLIRLVKILFQ